MNKFKPLNQVQNQKRQMEHQMKEGELLRQISLKPLYFRI
jgi:hypothetical protein